MAPQHIGRRALLPVLGLGVCVAGMTATARAQDIIGENDVVYVKRLDVRLNPTPHGVQEDAKTTEAELPPPPQSKGFLRDRAEAAVSDRAAGRPGRKLAGHQRCALQGRVLEERRQH